MFVALSGLCPSLISIVLERKLLKKKFFKVEDCINYGIYCLFNNIFTIIFMICVFKIKVNIGENIILYPGIFVKYSIVAIINSIILSLIKVGFVKNVEVEIETK